MYASSAAFRNAVANNAPQKALFFFNDGVITNEDINIETEVEFKDYFCTQDDLSIGEALSNELSFRLFNEKQKLNEFPFGEFVAMLGARISTQQTNYGLILEYGGHTYQGTAIRGRFLLRDGSPATNQPGFAVTSLAAKDGIVYCFGENGQPYAIINSSGAHISCPDNAFMRDKASRWNGYTFAYDNRILTQVWAGHTIDTYEFVPLGTFIAKRPNVVDDVEIDMHCNDLMTKFDTNFDLELTYPIAAKAVLQAVCSSESVPLAVTSFLNEDATLSEKPARFDSCTKRDVIAWIAEIAGCNAKINRDGSLAFVWVSSTSQSFDASKYTECRPYYYKTKKISKLHSENTSKTTTQEIGTGTNGYLIQDNPFITDAEEGE